MAKTAHSEFRSEDELLAFFAGEALGSSGPVAIVAGHFMLAYDDQQRCLVPMVWQDTNHPWVRHFSKEMAQDFPLRSFRLGLQIRQRLNDLGRAAGVVLLVNDHIFQTDAWHGQNLPTEPTELAASLRHEYYRSKSPLPSSYFNAVQGMAAGEQESVFIRNDNSRRTKTDIVPKRSIFFSEQALRRRFDEKTRQRLIDDAHFTHVEARNGKYRVYFRGEDNAPEVCLIDEVGCDCSGEVLELLLHLDERGYSTIVFLSPQECAFAVHGGATATAYIVGLQTKHLNVITVAGLGGMGVETTGDAAPCLTANLVKS